MASVKLVLGFKAMGGKTKGRIRTGAKNSIFVMSHSCVSNEWKILCMDQQVLAPED